MRASKADVQSCIQSVKDTKFKAIHNIEIILTFKLKVVFNLSKIQNLKRFTTIIIFVMKIYSCIQSVKDTKFKAIHNRFLFNCFVFMLYSICQRYKI